jgi:processive 1,2-diacylglycerol beta-glucosyltransferase
VKRILILTASYGEGHNAAARGLRDALARLAPSAEVEVHDLFATTYGRFNQVLRKAYATLINRWPRAWGVVYDWLDRQNEFDTDLKRFFFPVRKQFALLLARFQPDVVVSVFPPYPYLLEQISPQRNCRSVVVVTDSITVNAIWYRSRADYILVPNEPSAAVVRAAGIAPERIKTFGFPVNPKFADYASDRPPPSGTETAHLLYMISAGTRQAPDIVRRLLDLGVQLTVTVGRDKKLRRRIERSSQGRRIEIVGWTDQLPQLLTASHLLIGKAGGATVQETIAAGCPMIINHVVSGQEEGNAQLILQTNSGTIAYRPDEVVDQVKRAFANNAALWREWSNNIAQLSRPRAALEIAEFLLAL